MKELNSIKELDNSLTMSIKEAGLKFGKGGTAYRKQNSGNTTSLLLLIVVLVILGIVFGPLITIWALNGLFGLSITYTLKHWFCALLLGGAIRGFNFSAKKD